MVRSDTARRGKGHALDYAFQKLLLEPFDAFMVLDADSTISPNAALEVGSRIAAGADALQIRYEVRNVAESSHTRLVSLGFLAFNVVRPRGRAALGLSSGILGNGFALTRNTLESIPYQAFSIVEDLEYHLRLVRAGRLVQFVDTAKVLGEMPAKRADSAGQRARWEGGRLRVASTALPGLVKEIARGRWRLIEPALELLTIPLGFLVCILMAMLLIPLSAARMFAFTGLLITGTHVLTAAIAGGSPWRTLRAMATVPAYVFWKLTTLAALRRTASHEAAWIRATREEH
jgi:cellulose synthase/poly-beta-1,6-N-acetylglucosamine synthase-like glycosyltransferase